MTGHWFNSWLDQIAYKTEGDIDVAIERLSCELHHTVAALTIIHRRFPPVSLERKRKAAQDALIVLEPLRKLAKEMEDK